MMARLLLAAMLVSMTAAIKTAAPVRAGILDPLPGRGIDVFQDLQKSLISGISQASHFFSSIGMRMQYGSANVALGKSVEASCNGSDPAIVTDGTYKGFYAQRSCDEEQDQPSWIKIDLGRIHVIDKITLAGIPPLSIDIFLSRWTVHIGSHGNTNDTLCHEEVLSAAEGSFSDTVDIWCDSPVAGRYITLSSSHFMSLSELEAYSSTNLAGGFMSHEAQEMQHKITQLGQLEMDLEFKDGSEKTFENASYANSQLQHLADMLNGTSGAISIVGCTWLPKDNFRQFLVDGRSRVVQSKLLELGVPKGKMRIGRPRFSDKRRILIMKAGRTEL